MKIDAHRFVRAKTTVLGKVAQRKLVACSRHTSANWFKVQIAVIV